ncbi:MAG: hypothetical protein MZV63_63415 [Marinilabiliales bacterium]|nr:hypothetical protein [Marinilabiliales bacterium]
MDAILNVVLIGVISVSAITDILQGKIYNKVVYPVIVIALLLSVFGGAMAMKSSFVGALCGFLIFIIVYLIGGVGVEMSSW